MNILIVEDDPLLRSGIAEALRRWRHVVGLAADLRSAFRAWEIGRFDAILLDLRLGAEDGLDFLRHLRRLKDKTPVIVATARDAIADRVEGLDAGADDYLVKPFSLDELAARLRALERRVRGAASDAIVLGKLTLEPAGGGADYDGAPLALARRELLLLRALAERAGRLVTRDALVDAVYGDEAISSNALEVHIHALRRKLGKESIRTVRGLGYLLSETP